MRLRTATGILSWAIIVLVAGVGLISAQPIFEEGDWISYRDYRWIYSSCVGPRKVYLGTTKGVVTYHRFSNKYSDYWARTTGYHQSEPLDSVRAIAYDPKTQSLWCGTEAGLYQREEPQDRWRLHMLPGIPSGYKVLSIGVGNNYIWVEAGPANLWWNPFAGFTEFFLYSGSLFSGGFTRFRTGHFIPPASNGLLPGMSNVETQVTWYGRLGKQPLNSDDMSGLLGVGRFNIPVLFSDEPGIRFQEGDAWRPGYFEDAEFRQYAVTDWKVDDRGILWLGTWGLGLGKADLRTQHVGLKPAGLFGEDVRALAFHNKDIWIAGVNNLPHQGITRWQGGRRWEGYESLYIRGLESTLVHDLAIGNGAMWAATSEGLVRYDLRKKYWQNLGVFKGMWSDRVLTVTTFTGDVYAGTDRGVNRISGDVVFREEGWFRNYGVHRFAVDGDTIWAACDDGIYRKVNGKSWKFLDDPMGTIGPETVDIALTPRIVWFARRDGIEGYRRDGGPGKSLLATHYFDGQRPNCIAADLQNLWVGTDKGLYQFNLEKGIVLHRYQPQDGLLSGKVQTLTLDGDFLWIGTPKGLCRFFWNDPIRGY